MNRRLAIVVLLCTVLGGLFAAEIVDFRDEALLPADWEELARQARARAGRDAEVARLAERLAGRGWQLPVDPAWRAPRILPAGFLWSLVPEELRPRRAADPLDDPDALFARFDLRYLDETYQRARYQFDNRFDDGAQKGQTNVKDGWKWDISKDVRLVLRGSQDIELGYGFDVVDQNLREGAHARRVGVLSGFRLAQNLNVTLVGRVGPKISVSIDHNSRRKDNVYDIRYQGRTNEVIREIKAGNIDLAIPSSRYVVYSGGSKEAFGIKGVLGTKNFQLQAILSLTKGVTETKRFVGAKTENRIQLRETEYVKHLYYTVPDRGLDANTLELWLTTTETNGSRPLDGGLYKQLIAGRDYSFDRTSGRLDMVRAVTRDQNLLAFYTVSGAPVPGAALSPAGSFAAGETVVADGKTWLYLKRIAYPSRFERKGFYRLGATGIDVARGFEFYVVNTADGARSGAVQFSAAQYRLDASAGTLEFTEAEPFRGKAGIPPSLYDSATDPQVSDSVYSLYFIFLARVDSYQLRFNLNPGSERVSINGRQLARDRDYVLDYMTGTLRFLAPINENDNIEASYEYKPYGGSLQRTLFGMRADWVPVGGLELGTTLFYSGGQKPVGAPAAGAEPDSILVFDVDARLNLLKLAGFDWPGWTARVDAELAVSVHDKNTVGSAIVADMEGDGLGYAVTRSEELWKLASPSTNIPGLTQANRGQLLYRDYRDYGVNEHFTLQSYNWDIPPGKDPDQVAPYSRKPGPYTVLGGRNESTSEMTENSLVFEYDFEGGARTWVAAATSIAGPGGLDLSKVNELLFSLKHQRWTGTDGAGRATYASEAGGSVQLFLEVGQLDEDADGDGLLDVEKTIGSSGYEFTPAGGVAPSTWIGGGRKGAGNGTVDSEDMNGDAVMTTNEQSLLLPLTNVTSSVALAVPTGSEWQEYSLPLRNLTAAQLRILERATAIRLTLVRNGSDRGRLLVDRAYLKGTRWEALRIDGVPLKTAPEFAASVISARENAEYRDNRFYKSYATDFETLHGSLSAAEEEQFNEKALQLVYALSGTVRPDAAGPGGAFASVSRINNANQDLTFYRTLILYAYVKAKSPEDDEYLSFRLGNADDRYYEWRIPVSALGTAAARRAAGKAGWIKIELQINPDDASRRFQALVDGAVVATATTTAKRPNLREVNRTVLGVGTTTPGGARAGEIWINEAHVADSRTRSATALSLRGEIASPNKTLFRLFGLPVLGPFALRWDLSRTGSGFRSIGQEGQDATLRNWTASGSVNLLRYLTLGFQYADERRASDTDENRLPLFLQYAATNLTWKHSLAYADPRGYFPTIEHSYGRGTIFDVSHRLDTAALAATNDSLIDVWKRQYSESATLAVRGKLPLGFTHAYQLSDSYFLNDISIRSNGGAGSWYTNNTTQAVATWSKKESLNLGFERGNLPGLGRATLVLGASFFNEMERSDRGVSRAGLRAEFERLERLPLVDAYRDRLAELLSGAGAVGTALDGTNLSAQARGVTVNAALRNLGPLTVDYTLTRSGRDANYLRLTNFQLVKNNATTAKSTLRTVLELPAFPLRALTAEAGSDFSFAETSGGTTLDAAWAAYQGAFFMPPLYYLGLFGGDGRFRETDAVRRLADQSPQSYVTFRNSASLSARFDYGKSWLGAFLPESFTWSMTQNSARNLASLAQARAWAVTVNKRFPLRKLGFWIFDESSQRGKSVQDLDVRLGLDRKYDYNAKTIADALSASAAWSVRWSADNALSLGWSLVRSRTRQSLLSTDPGYQYLGIGRDSDDDGDSFGDLEEANGAAPSFPAAATLTRSEQTIRVEHSFASKHGPEWSIFGLKVKIDTLWKHRTEAVLKFVGAAYDPLRDGRHVFSELFDRDFFLSLKHSIDYDFSESWNGTFYLSLLFERWKLVKPSDTGDTTVEEAFPLSWGAEIGVKMQIRF